MIIRDRNERYPYIDNIMVVMATPQLKQWQVITTMSTLQYISLGTHMHTYIHTDLQMVPHHIVAI